MRHNATPMVVPTTPLNDQELLTWRHCPRRHWLNRRAAGGRVAPVSAIDSPGTRAALKATWPRAHYLPPPQTDEEWLEAVHLTQAWLNSGELLDGEGHALLGACVASNEGARARIDVLSSGERGLRIGRLRLATSGNDDDIDLIAWWTHVAARSGVRVHGVHLMLIEQDFVYPGHGCMAGVFREVDVSPVLGTRDVPAWMVGMRQTERGPQPALPDKLNCLRPSEHEAPCPHLSHCGLSQRLRDGLAPDALEVMGREMADVLRAMGYRELLAVPEAMLPDARRRRAWRAILAGRPIIEPEVAAKVRALPRPWHLLRLDTIGHALPIWAGTRPYQIIPFQWACDLIDGPEAMDHTPIHHHHLAQGTGDPRRTLALSLLKVLGSQGTVFAYNAGFERNRLAELARHMPDLAGPLEAVQARIIDLFQVLRAHAYHPAMRGSWSFKSVCRAMVPEVHIQRFEPPHVTPAEVYAHSMQDRLSAPEVKQLREALIQHGRQEVAALRAILRLLVHADDAS
jgi:Domain of unknown function(DUF2779)